MSERDPNLMSIGRFSETTRLSVKALRLYDEQGLLVPEQVDESNGYRYYGPAQVPRAQAVRMLRSMDMPLNEIAKVLDASPENRDRLMTAHLQRLETHLASLRQKVAAFGELAEGRKSLMPYEVAVKDVVATDIVSVEAEVDLKGVGEAIGQGFGTIMGVLGPAGIPPAGAPFVIYHDVIDEENPGKIEICMPVAGPFDGNGVVAGKTLPGGKAAWTIHKGPYEEVASAYHAVSSWMSSNGYKPAAPPAEIYLNDPSEVSVSEQLTEVLWAITEV